MHHELRCSCCGVNGMAQEHIDKMQRIRDIYYATTGKGLIVTSAYRCPKHNLEVSETGSNGPHTTGYAMDFLAHGAEALLLISIAYQNGMTGFGVAQKGPRETRIVHLDSLPNKAGQPRPWVWTY